jgi:hypothetical protein
VSLCCANVLLVYLHYAFPARTARPDVDSRAVGLHDLRNRVAHHEPLLTEDLRSKHALLLELADLVEPSLALHIKATTRLPALIASRPAHVEDEVDQEDDHQDDQEVEPEGGG